MMANKFYTYQTDYWCTRPPSHAHLSQEEWLNISAPMDSNGDYDRCAIFDVNYDNLWLRPEDGTGTVKCTSWEYDAHYFDVRFKKNLLNLFKTRVINAIQRY